MAPPGFSSSATRPQWRLPFQDGLGYAFDGMDAALVAFILPSATAVFSQSTYDTVGVPGWAGPVFARQQAKLAALGEDVIHVRADGSGHWIHEDRPDVLLQAISTVLEAARSGEPLPSCEAAFEIHRVTCL